MLLGHGPNKIFLVPNSCRETERNGDSISAASLMTPLKTNRTTLVSIIFRQYGKCFGHFDIT